MEHNKDIADIQAAEATSQKKKKFILCYHSFSVLNYKRASVQIRKIADAAGSPISIAVIPSFGAAPESEAEEFREELEKFVDEGYEIMLHGARHRADLSLKRSISGKIALWISNNEAEFAGIDERFTQRSQYTAEESGKFKLSAELDLRNGSLDYPFVRKKQIQGKSGARIVFDGI